jgi:drug/metabolite transporter (DMT)-like permease
VKLSRGVLYMATSALSFSGMGLLVKLTSSRLPTGEIVFARAVVTLALSYGMLRRADLSPWGTARMALVLRGLLGFGGLSGYYLAIAHMQLADATTIQNSTPLITAVLAWWLLDERIGWSTAIAIACGIAGVALIVHPSAAGFDPIGVGFGLGSVICSSIAYVTVRKLARTEHPLVIVFYFPLVATPLALPWVIASFVVPRPIDWLVLAGIGVTTQVGQVFLTKGLAIERAGRATTVGYLQVGFAMLWQLLVFGEVPTPWTLVGASLILGGTLVVAQVTGELVRRSSRSPRPPQVSQPVSLPRAPSSPGS